MSGKRPVSPTQLHHFCCRVLERLGVPPQDARVVADHLVDADLRGVESHGVVRLLQYARRIREGGLSPVTRLTPVSDQGTVVVLDAHGGIGQVAGLQAMQLAIQRARAHGVGVVAVRESNHLGVMGYYARLAAAQEMVGFAISGAAASIAPWGGAEPLLGSNPWALGVPARRHPPLIIDMANTVVIAGKVREAAEKGEPIPPGWALGPDGLPTQDARQAMQGSLLAFGGVKGAALTLGWEVLASVLTGAAYSTDIPALTDMGRPQRLGHLFVALRIDAFLPLETFYARVDDLLDRLKASRAAVGQTAIRLPGERGEQLAASRRVDGIPLPEGLWARLDGLAAELGVEGLSSHAG